MGTKETLDTSRARSLGGIAAGLALLVFLLPWSSALAQTVQGPPEVTPEVHHDVSRPLADITPLGDDRPPHQRPLGKVPPTALTSNSSGAVQSSAGPAVQTAPGLGFDGVGNGFVGPQGSFTVNVAPPDTNGAVGATQFVEFVNTSFAVFDKNTGATIYGPAAGNTIWTGFGAPCQTTNDGDVIAQYDKLASRWILSQLSFSQGPPYYLCIAVSTTSNATGTYNRYAFSYTNLNDYPKIGVWPDAYYVSYNMFQSNAFVGSQVCAFDRNAMLAGSTATQQCFQLSSNFGGLLPSDLDGTRPPPLGSPNYFVNFGNNSLNFWQFHVNWTSPVNTTLTGPTNIPVAAFNEACGGGVCIPQSGTTEPLDSLGDRLMYRLAYRNFGDHEALVANHSVTAGSSVGVRWYEVRNPGTPVIFQQGTYAPDSNYRWMGSIAMDHVGDIAVGYSVSGSGMHPAIRYTGRVPSDTPGTLEGEASIIEGTGSQTTNLERWGDYSSISVDPVDDCTFWYTNEYLKTNGTFNWSTRIDSFKFLACTTPPPAPTGLTAMAGNQQVSLLWSPAAGATSYNVLRSTTNGGPYTTIATGLTTTSYTDVGLTNGITYYYVVQAVNSAGTSPNSNQASATPTTTGAVANFVSSDASTQGSWHGVYGADGYSIANDSQSLPAYASFAVQNQLNYTWVSSTTNPRALQKGSGTGRIAATWFSSSTFNFDVNFTDGNTRRFAVYALDWDSTTRAETIQIVDANSNAVLDTRHIASFNNGIYLVWNISGHVKINITRTGGANAVISGAFFGGSTGAETVSVTPQSVTLTANQQQQFAATVSGTSNQTVSWSIGSVNPPTAPSGNLSSTGLYTAPATITPAQVTIKATSADGTASGTATVNLTAGAVANFVSSDTSTQGSWHGVYGGDGYSIANESQSLPAYASFAVQNQLNYTWVSSTTDPRALQTGSGTGRIAATWFNSSTFNFDVNFTDGNAHRFAVYALDWDSTTRVETIQIVDANSNAVLDTRNIASFHNGIYLVWNISGHVKINIARASGANAVISGAFFK